MIEDQSRAWQDGVRAAAAFAGEWDKQITGTPYKFEDIILCKLNLLAKSKLRKKPGSGPDAARLSQFVRALAEYLVGNQAHMSILLEIGKPEAIKWQKLRSQTPLMGYPTVDEAEKALRGFLRVER
jgi:hypothetical protein